MSFLIPRKYINLLLVISQIYKMFYHKSYYVFIIYSSFTFLLSFKMLHTWINFRHLYILKGVRWVIKSSFVDQSINTKRRRFPYKTIMGFTEGKEKKNRDTKKCFKNIVYWNVFRSIRAVRIIKRNACCDWLFPSM